jgi:hypothetical protein
MRTVSWRITTSSDELREGLFGQIVLWTFELLPYLQRKAIFPIWDIKSSLYGTEPDYTVIPGVFDLAYCPSDRAYAEVNFLALRNTYVSVLGSDWHYLNRLWNLYFRIPDRTQAAAGRISLSPNSLGVHYRGNDKNQSSWDTNPVSQEDFLTLVEDFLKKHLHIKSIFVATDEFSFVDRALRQLSPLRVINLGEVPFHKASQNVPHNGDRALLDCLLLSRCKYLLKCSSALSGFAKVLNPQLESYRVSASKLFTDIPYFPEAYIPKLTSADPNCTRILERQFANDWLADPYAKVRFGKPFRTQPRYRNSVRLKRWIKSLMSRSARRSRIEKNPAID